MSTTRTFVVPLGREGRQARYQRRGGIAVWCDDATKPCNVMRGNVQRGVGGKAGGGLPCWCRTAGAFGLCRQHRGLIGVIAQQGRVARGHWGWAGGSRCLQLHAQHATLLKRCERSHIYWTWQRWRRSAGCCFIGAAGQEGEGITSLGVGLLSSLTSFHLTYTPGVARLGSVLVFPPWSIYL
jgi:hypothetical protein